MKNIHLHVTPRYLHLTGKTIFFINGFKYNKAAKGKAARVYLYQNRSSVLYQV